MSVKLNIREKNILSMEIKAYEIHFRNAERLTDLLALF